MSPGALVTQNGAGRQNGEHSTALKPGVYVPTVAFFKEDESLDLDATAKHVAFLAGTGIAGLVTHGSNGEAVHFDHEERMSVTAATRKALDDAGKHKLPVIVGCGAASTRETIQLCKESSQSGGSHALILPPSYYKSLLTTRMLLDHFRAVADASPIPIVIYNFPGAASGLDMDSDQILELAQHPNIVGSKLTCGNTGKLCRVAASVKPGFATMGGSADFILPSLIMGGQGVIAGLANLAPRACVEVMTLYQQGKVTEAQQLQAVVARGDWVAIKGGFVAVKSGLKAYNGANGVVRGPTVADEGVALQSLTKAFGELMAVEATLSKRSQKD